MFADAGTLARFLRPYAVIRYASSLVWVRVTVAEKAMRARGEDGVKICKIGDVWWPRFLNLHGSGSDAVCEMLTWLHPLELGGLSC